MSTNHTPTPWATDGRWIVQDMDGRSFWPGQSFIADCVPSESAPNRGTENTKANAELIVLAVNSRVRMFEALEMAEATIQRLQRHAPGSANGTLDVIRDALKSANGK